MHTLAKRIYDLAPGDVRQTFADGSTVTLAMRPAEFFRESFQAEGVDGTGTTYRLVPDGGGDPLVAGREDAHGWSTVWEVAGVEPAG